MNKKEISEVKKQFQKNKHAIDRICGCYVDNEKRIRTTFGKTFGLLPEEEQFKYYAIFKKAMSGTIGKTLHTLDFSIEEELTGEGHKMLLALRDSSLKDDTLLLSFYQKVIDHYEFGENYYIVLIHSNYDVPGKGTDELEMEDASERVYEHIMCCICPVVLSEAGLGYNAVDNIIEEREQNWWVELPMNGFLFPAFHDRDADIHSILYYTKKPEVLHSEFLEGCIGGPTPMSFKSQKEVFQDILAETLGDDSGYEVVRQVQEELSDLVLEHKEEPEPLRLSKPEMKQILERSGVEAEKLEQFDRIYTEKAGEKTTFLADNLISTKSVNIKTGMVKIQVDPDCVDMISTQFLDGRKCLVIPVDHNVEINGLQARVGAEEKMEE